MGVSARPVAGDATPDAGDAEVVAHAGDARLAHRPDHGLDVFHLLLFARAVQEDVVPVGGVKVFDSRDLQTGVVDRGSQVSQFFVGPELVVIVGVAPAIAAAGGAEAVVAAKIVGEMHDEARRARLPGKAKVVRGEHVAIEAQA